MKSETRLANRLFQTHFGLFAVITFKRSLIFIGHPVLASQRPVVYDRIALIETYIGRTLIACVSAREGAVAANAITHRVRVEMGDAFGRAAATGKNSGKSGRT